MRKREKILAKEENSLEAFKVIRRPKLGNRSDKSAYKQSKLAIDLLTLESSDEKRPLAMLGINEKEELVYRTLLMQHTATIQEVSQLTELSLKETKMLLQHIEAKGLTTHLLEEPHRYIAMPPDFAIEALATQRHADIDRARAVVVDLRRHELKFKNDSERAKLVEVITNNAAAGQIYEQLLQSAENEVVAFQRAPNMFPYLPHENIAMRAHIRTVSDASYLSLPMMLDRLRSEAAQGQDIRTFPKLPIKLAIFDQRIGIVLNTDDPISPMLVVRPCPLLDALYSLFELVWEKSTPLIFHQDHQSETEKNTPRLSGEAGTLIPMLSAGISEKTIAHQTGVSYTTLTRRIKRLMKAYNARTRFQLGWKAALESKPLGESIKKGCDIN